MKIVVCCSFFFFPLRLPFILQSGCGEILRCKTSQFFGVKYADLSPLWIFTLFLIFEIVRKSFFPQECKNIFLSVLMFFFLYLISSSSEICFVLKKEVIIQFYLFFQTVGPLFPNYLLRHPPFNPCLVKLP